MEKCSELVMRLHGSEATDGMFDLVFGRNPGELLKFIYDLVSLLLPLVLHFYCRFLCHGHCSETQEPEHMSIDILWQQIKQAEFEKQACFSSLLTF